MQVVPAIVDPLNTQPDFGAVVYSILLNQLVGHVVQLVYLGFELVYFGLQFLQRQAKGKVSECTLVLHQ